MRAIASRAYADESDERRLQALACQFADAHLHAVDIPYRLSSWALEDPENGRLWESADGCLEGWVVLQTPFWSIDFACRPEMAASLLPEILAWAWSRAQAIKATRFGRPAWFVNVFTGQQKQVGILEAAGFTCQSGAGVDSWSKMLLQHTREAPLARLPDGFTLRPLAGQEEVDSYVQLHRAAFESPNMTSAWRRRTLLQPGYSPDLDLVVVSPDQRLEAFCIGWLGKRGDGVLVGQVEPLGVHPDFRGHGLGRAILAEGLRRLYGCGASLIYVETDSYREPALKLYERCGFVPYRQVLAFRKDGE